MIRVLVVDDQEIVRAGLRTILESSGDIEVVAEAGEGRSAIEIASRTSPDVVLMDIRMPELDGIAATRELTLAEPNTNVLILTTYGLDDNIDDALRAGAAGFVTKSTAPDQLIAAVRQVARGESVLGADVTRQLIHRLVSQPTRPDRPAAFETLTPREIEVLTLVADGLSNTEIASELLVSEATVKTHISRMLTKLGLRDRVQAVVFAHDFGIRTP
jgi:DNA-binding NarL/FixJ family response regulator